MTIDIDELRRDLMDYYGSATQSGFPMAVIELSDVENASSYKLIEMAKNAGFDLADYSVEDDFER